MKVNTEPVSQSQGGSERQRPIESIDLIGGELCLDFANSLGGTRATPSERLFGYDDLVSWGVHAGAIGEDEARALRARAAREPDEAARVFGRGLELREAVYRIFAAIARGETPEPGDIDRLNAEVEPAFARLRVAPADGGFDYRFADDTRLDRVLWPIARSGAELLVSDELGRIKQCQGRDCGWLFLDQSKNRSRRWCDMSDCGNRAKARRHYRRVKRARGV